MSLSNFRVLSNCPAREFVRVIADDGEVRAIAQIDRAIIEDALSNADYLRDRFAFVERNLDALTPIIQAKFDSGAFTDFEYPPGFVSGNDKLIIIDRAALLGCKLR